MEPKPKAHLFTFAVMALFIFVFLGSEYHFDIAYGELAGPDLVVGAQASILATSAIGLVGYSLVNRTAGAFLPACWEPFPPCSLSQLS